MIALAVGLAVTLAGCVALIAWLTYRVVSAADAFAKVRVAQAETEAHLEQSQFEASALRTALANAERRADALEGVLADEVNNAPDPNLARGDVRGRLLRIAQQWGRASSQSFDKPDRTPHVEAIKNEQAG